MDQIPAGQDAPFQTPEKTEADIDLWGLLSYFADHWKLFLICILAGALLMAGCTAFLMTPKYEAVSKMYVLGSGHSELSLSDVQIGTYLVSDFQEIFYTREVTAAVISRLNLNYTYEQMQEMLKVVHPSGTHVLHIIVTHPDPALAADAANEFLDAAGQYAAEVMGTEKPAMLSAAVLPEEPVSPHMARNIVLGAAAGFVLICICLFIRYMLNEQRGMR